MATFGHFGLPGRSVHDQGQLVRVHTNPSPMATHAGCNGVCSAAPGRPAVPCLAWCRARPATRPATQPKAPCAIRVTQGDLGRLSRPPATFSRPFTVHHATLFIILSHRSSRHRGSAPHRAPLSCSPPGHSLPSPHSCLPLRHLLIHSFRLKLDVAATLAGIGLELLTPPFGRLDFPIMGGFWLVMGGDHLFS